VGFKVGGRGLEPLTSCV